MWKWLVVILLFSVYTPLVNAEVYSIQSRYHDFLANEQSAKNLPDDNELVASVKKSYDNLFHQPSQKEFKLLSDADVLLLYRAADMTAFYTADKAYADDMRLYLDELQKRNIANRPQYFDYYRTLIQNRQFDEAAVFAAGHGITDGAKQPRFVDHVRESGVKPTELIVDPSARILTRTPLMLAGAEILVIGSPSCHFTQNAVRDIDADPSMREAFKAHALWLEPVDRDLEFDETQSWNRQHPNYAMAIAYNRNEWPMVSTWETPTFYFLYNGKVVGTVVGWPKEGNMKKIQAKIKEIGL